MSHIYYFQGVLAAIIIIILIIRNSYIAPNPTWLAQSTSQFKTRMDIRINTWNMHTPDDPMKGYFSQERQTDKQITDRPADKTIMLMSWRPTQNCGSGAYPISCSVNTHVTRSPGSFCPTLTQFRPVPSFKSVSNFADWFHVQAKIAYPILWCLVSPNRQTIYTQRFAFVLVVPQCFQLLYSSGHLRGGVSHFWCRIQEPEPLSIGHRASGNYLGLVNISGPASQFIHEIQPHKRFKITLFIRTKHNMRIFGVIPFINQSKINQSINISL